MMLDSVLSLFPPHAGNLGTRFHITKYPTLKYVRNGIVAKREYRGKREVDAFINFIREQTTDPIEEYQDVQDLTNLDVSRQLVLLLFGKSRLNSFFRARSAISSATLRRRSRPSTRTSAGWPPI